MSRPNPVKALNGVRSGHICDRCNKCVRTGDLVRAYTTHYEQEGWMLRQVRCVECGESTLEKETDGADEAIVEALFWRHQLISVKVRDWSPP